MPIYEPLHIDPEIEEQVLGRRSSFQLALCKLQQYCPFRIYHQLPYGRSSIESQLRARLTFPEEDWATVHYRLADVVVVLRVLQKEMNLPNANLIRKDPLNLVLLPDYDDLPHESVRVGIREATRVHLARNDFLDLCRDGSTVEQLVDRVLGVPRRQEVGHQ